ncbi:MAG: phosphate ABC transporter permease subunit PstC [Armatimonadetes bacterium]|nr:phosphate ABC transporter permease subunit PstC [Armatimonadota bacterium]
MEGLRERLIARTLLVVACSVVLALAIITYFIFRAGLPIIFHLGLDDFLFSTRWMPADEGGSYGIGAMALGSLWVTLGALVVGVPLGVAVAVFSAELAPTWLANLIRPAIQLLAGIPSVIYGFVGLMVLVPWVRQHLGGPGLCVFTAAIVLGIMILPNIISISEDSLRAVPPAYRQGALALGATRWQTIWGVLIPAARSGIMASIILGMGRALGETMAVIMMIGNSLQVPRSLLDPATTLTSNIGLEMAYASGQHREALFATGVVLFAFIMILNLIANVVSRRRVQA